MHLHAGEGCPNTIVNASAEAKMLIVCTVWVKAVRIRKASWIAAARGQQEHHGRALWDGDTGYVDICKSCAGAKLHRRIIALHLFDCADDHFMVPTQSYENIRMTQQRKHAIGDQVNGSLETSAEQQSYGREKLLLVHLFSVVLTGCHQGRYQIITWPIVTSGNKAA